MPFSEGLGIHLKPLRIGSMQDPFVPIDEEPAPSGSALLTETSRTLRNLLCRISSRQLVLQEVIQSTEGCSYMYGFFKIAFSHTGRCEYTQRGAKAAGQRRRGRLMSKHIQRT